MWDLQQTGSRHCSKGEENKSSLGTGIPERMHNISAANGWKASGKMSF